MALANLLQFPVLMVDKNTPNSLIRPAGYITPRVGILSYLYIAAHERGHQFAFTSSSMTTKINNVVQKTFYGDFGNDPAKREYDNLNKDWKFLHHMSDVSSDTTGAYPNYDTFQVGTDKPDNEVVADIQALAPLFDQGDNLWKQDWSNMGMQFYSDKSKLPDTFLNVNKQLTYDFIPVYGPNSGATIKVTKSTDIQSAIFDPDHPANNIYTIVTSLGDLNN